MTEETKLAVLREAVERADALASAQARTIEVQREVIDLLHQRIGVLERHVNELSVP